MNMIRQCPPTLKIRPFRAGDARSTRTVYHNAVLNGTTAHYTHAQRIAWAGSRVASPEWARRLGGQHTLVATLEGRVVGFMSMDRQGYLDMAFVQPLLMGRGVAEKLYNGLESWAQKSGLTRIYTEASHLARPFFERRGWSTLTKQTVNIRGQDLENFKMEKRF